MPQKKRLEDVTLDNESLLLSTYHTVAIVAIAILNTGALLAKQSFPQTNKRHQSINPSGRVCAWERTRVHTAQAASKVKISE